MFRRSKTAEAPSAPETVKVGGKGRPTPSRKEAQAAARARAKGPQDKKAAARAQRERRTESSATIREGMKRGDERYLPARDKGPVRRFVRDWIDARLCMAELLLPLLILIMVGQAFSPSLANGLWSATILLVALDTALVVFRLRRELRRRLPGREHEGRRRLRRAALHPAPLDPAPQAPGQARRQAPRPLLSRFLRHRRVSGADIGSNPWKSAILVQVA